MPAVLAVPGEPARTLDGPTGPPVGVSFGQRRTATFELPPGAVLCFYTDGLIERRDVPLEHNLRRLCDIATADGPAENLCHTIMNELIGASRPKTSGTSRAGAGLRRRNVGECGVDTALLVLHRLPVHPAIDTDTPAQLPHSDRATPRPAARPTTPHAARNDPARPRRRGDPSDPHDPSATRRPARRVPAIRDG
jgi:Stage II sporulation protein E (SpoIIE)